MDRSIPSEALLQEMRQAKEIALRRKRLARLLRKPRVMRKSLPKRGQLLRPRNGDAFRILLRAKCS